MLRIHTSHRTEVLLDVFVRALAAERQATSGFTPIRVVVPNKNIETYLRLGVAERLGIAANIKTSFLRRFLAGLAEQALPDARVADAAVVEGHLLAVLHDDDLLARPELLRVRGYLGSAGADPDAVDRRRCQLAASLARLYEEYAGSRPGMIAAWLDAKEADESRGAEDNPEIWQRALWLAVFGPSGRLARLAQGTRWLTLEALWDEAVQRSPATFAGKSVHVFGLSYIATAYHRMLQDLARASEVTVYTLNPCREDFAGQPASGEILPAEESLHPGLALWARPGRENLHLLARLPGASVTQDFPAGDAATLLHRVQHDIAHRQPPTAGPAEADGSLRVLPCPSLRRELEVVAAEIWRLLRQDPTLRACDIAVIVPEASKELYLAQLPAVFHESCDLPHNASDLPAASSHRVAEAIARLLDLPFSALTRKQLLPLLTHPCLMARFPGASREAWRALADELGIVRGADRRDFDPAYLDRDLYSWDQGLVRLALGAVVDGREAATPVAFAGDLYLPGPAVDDNDDEARLGFGLLARSLIADAAFASGKRGPRERPLGEWLAFLRNLIRSYLVLDEDDDAGHGVVARFLAALDDFAEAGLDDTRVAYRIAAELAKRALGSLPGSRGHYLASGVSVASFVPMRAIPFRAVFVVGLGQDAFPRPPGRDELDLRRASRLPGDVDRREQDLYMFLETLLSTRDHLCLSYVCRDEITGDELPASSLLLELRALLGRGYLDQQPLARLFADERGARPPLRRYDDSEERRAVLPAAQAEHETKRRRGEPVVTTPELLAARLVQQPTSPSVVAGEGMSVVEIPLWALRQFLQDPLQGSARFLLGMRPDEDADDADLEDEPFDLEKLLAATIVRESMVAAMLEARGTPAWETLDGIRQRQTLVTELAGKSPAGIFRAAGAAQTEAILRDWHGELQQLSWNASARLGSYRFVPSLDVGKEETPAQATVIGRPAPSFTLELPVGHSLRSLPVRIVGQTGLWAAGAEEGALAFSFTCRSSIRAHKLGADELRVFLEYVTLAAAGGPGTLPGARSVLFYSANGTNRKRVWRFGPLPRERAQDYLQKLCSELFVGLRVHGGMPTFAHPYLLPHEAVLASRESGSPGIVQEIARLVDGADSRRFSSQYGPVRDVVGRYLAPTPAEAERMVNARFGLFFTLAEREETP